jgi:Dna[CI] antecedent DciA-like protein
MGGIVGEMADGGWGIADGLYLLGYDVIVMATKDPYQSHLEGLRERRNRKEPDLSLGFMVGQFKREVQKPYEQLGELAGIWEELVPGELAAHTRLVGLTRGVLRVAVGSSGRLYELDRLLRSGVFDELVTRHKGKAIRRVELKVGSVKSE